MIIHPNKLESLQIMLQSLNVINIWVLWERVDVIMLNKMKDLYIRMERE